MSAQTQETQETEQGAGARQRKTVTLSDEAIELGERLAREENRTFSNYVETLIIRDFRLSREVTA